MKKLIHFCLASFAIASAMSCDKDDDMTAMPQEPAVTVGPDQLAYWLTESNELVAGNANSPATFSSKTAVSGIPSGEKLLSIDFRPATGELYALSSASKFYIINTANASSRAVSTTAFTPAIARTVASIDFNPTVDRIRSVTNIGQNLRLNPETGIPAAMDTSIVTTSSIAGIAYTNSKSGASSTILYDLTTGKTTNIGKLQQKVIDIAIPTNPVAYAIDNSNALQIFDSNKPEPVTKPITGLQTGEGILGIDFRPMNGQLYALGSSSRLYTINLGTGAATQVGTGTLSTPLLGTEFGFDFNPTVDRIRVVSDLGQNLRLNPVDGSVAAVDGVINPGVPALSSAAYTDNFAGATTTSLLVIDHNTDKLYLQNPPNAGTLMERGSLGINITSANGFDIGSASQKAYLVASVGADTKIHTVNTTSGAATAIATYPNIVKGFTVGLGF